MNTQSNAFIITSTINTPFGLIHPSDRFVQTLDSIKSIRKMAKDSSIILVENSSFPLADEQYDMLKQSVNFFIDVGQRKYCLLLNKSGVKGAGDLYMTLLGLDIIKNHFPNPKRIFKLCGRYILTNEFDISEYDKHYGKFCFKRIGENNTGNKFLHTRLWSCCGSLLEEMKTLSQVACRTHLDESITIEEAIYKHIDLTKLVEFDTIHCDGFISPWNELIKD